MKGFIVGLGKMGRVHSRALVANGVEVVLGFDHSQENAELFTSETGIPAKSTEFLAASLLRHKPELVSIATTTPSRYDLFKGLMNHEGVQIIFMEKPFSSSLAQMSEMVLEGRRRRKKLVINHQMMFISHFVMIRNLAGEGDLGELVSINVSGSNFGLANKVSHYFEAFRYVTGGDVVGVSANLDDELIGSHRGPAFRDYSGRLTAWNSKDQFLHVDFSSRHRIGIFVTFGFEFGKVFVDEISGRAFIARIKSGVDTSGHIPYPAQQELEELAMTSGGIQEWTDRVIRAVMCGEDFPGIEAIQNSMKCIVACIHSSRQGGVPVAVTDEELSGIWDEEFLWS